MRTTAIIALVLTAFAASSAFAGSFLDALRAKRRGTSKSSDLVSSIDKAIDEGLRSKIVTIDALPTTMDEFVAMHKRVALSAEGGVAMFILAAKLYTKDKELGLQAFTLTLGPANLSEDLGGYEGYGPTIAFRGQLRYLDEKPWLADSFFVGTRQANGYALGSPPYRMKIVRNQATKQPDGAMRLMVDCSGALSRPFTVQRVDGVWVMKDNGSSLFVSVRVPPAVAAARTRKVKPGTVVIDQVPTTLDEYVALQNDVATTPEGGVVMYVLAAKLYVQDKDLGSAAFAKALAARHVSGSQPGSSFKFFMSKLDGMPWAPDAYFVGTAPGPLEAMVGQPKDQGKGAMQVAIKLRGGNPPRNFVVKQDDAGIWKLDGSESNLFLATNKP